jgi:anion-transporting  ArsA/GET3 family ATPase
LIADGHKLVIVSGKGGVGKSAITATLALSFHHVGRKVLAIDMTGAGGLASHLTVSALGSKPDEIRPGLWAMAIDRSQALIEYLRIQVGLPALPTFSPLARAFDALASTAPGVREVISIGKVLWEARRTEWDVVIADGPALGQIGSFLRAPRTVAELVPSGRVRQQADWMQEMMADDDMTEVVLVTVPEELPTLETEESLAWLADQHLTAPPLVVANRVLTPLATAAVGSAAVAEAAHLHRSLCREQEAWLDRLHPHYTLPFLFGMMTAGEVAARLAEVIGEGP